MCHDERDNLPPLLTAAEPVLQARGTAEIVVVDDGSTDDTVEWLRAREGPVPIRVVRHARRRGYGAAVRTGLAAAEGDVVVWMDGDGQYEPAQIPELLDLLDGGFDLVAGVRADRNDPPHRRFIAWAYNAVVQRTLSLDYEDVDCGFKVLNRKAVDALDLKCDGNLLGPEVYVKALDSGLRIRQIPVRHRPREHGRPKGADPFVWVHTARELVVHWRELLPRDRR